jgi:hypothetical protein
MKKNRFRIYKDISIINKEMRFNDKIINYIEEIAVKAFYNGAPINISNNPFSFILYVKRSDLYLNRIMITEDGLCIVKCDQKDGIKGVDKMIKFGEMKTEEIAKYLNI